MNNDKLEKIYKLAVEQYAEMGVNVEKALQRLKKIPISLHCWQGDDVGGFEKPDAELEGGGIQVTGNYPGKARTIPELRQDLEKVYSLLPGKHRLNLHAIYGDFNGTFVDRDKVDIKHFLSWIDWAHETEIKLDFNATCFSHPKADSGYTLSSKDNAVRHFWISHVQQARRISAEIGKRQDSICIHNLWIPDGSKDIPVDRFGYREILKNSLDEIYRIKYPETMMKDAVESKLFGIGSESFVVGSHEFYLNYAMKNKKIICLDLGHFHPTESIADKISSILVFCDELLLHVSRPVRWDSDHIVILNDDIQNLCQELVRCRKLENMYIGLDFFDASVNRIGAWVLGARSTLKGLLLALLEPQTKLQEYDSKQQYFARLALLEEAKKMPWGIIWDYYCLQNNVITDEKLIQDVNDYEKKILINRD